MKLPTFVNKKAAHEWLKLNREQVLRLKRAEMKCADGLYCPMPTVLMPDGALKEDASGDGEDPHQITVKVVINTTNLMDTYDDVHLPGLWKKTLKENKNLMHLQEHVMRFANIISDGADLKAYTQTMTWKELGQKWEGETEALVFESNVSDDRNAFMFDQYRKGWVKNHSVGMRYVTIELAVNSEDKYWKDEKKVWDKYRKEIVNGEMADEKGYFFAVTEAKAIEGSAVPAGANWVTPTLDNNLKWEPVQATPEGPSDDTLKRETVIQTIKNFKFN